MMSASLTKLSTYTREKILHTCCAHSTHNFSLAGFDKGKKVNKSASES